MSDVAEALSPPIEALVRLSASLADQTTNEAVLRAALASADSVQVEEVLLQAHLFVGYPATIEALALLRSLGGPAETGEGESLPSVVEGPSAGPERAERVMEEVYRERMDRVRETMRGLHPDLETWMVFDGYGRVLGRPGLSLICRELCIVAILAAVGRSRQLHSHLFGALHVGAPPGQIGAALEVGLEGGSETWRTAASELWSQVQARFEEHV